MRVIDKNTWKRKEYFDFFSKFDEPYYGIVSEVDCTKALKTAKEKGYSFFSFYLHKSLCAVNEIEEFRYRIEGDEVVLYDTVDAGPTIGREDGSFGFSLIKYSSDFKEFCESLKKEIEEVQNCEGLRCKREYARKDMVHYSSIPWISFTGLSHARVYKTQESVPKISFGKYFLRGDRFFMPVSVHVHHGLADGIHVAKYLKLFQKKMNE